MLLTNVRLEQSKDMEQLRIQQYPVNNTYNNPNDTSSFLIQ